MTISSLKSMKLKLGQSRLFYELEKKGIYPEGSLLDTACILSFLSWIGNYEATEYRWGDAHT
jgi:hypothetical protein